jgi:hypothetical protein
VDSEITRLREISLALTTAPFRLEVGVAIARLPTEHFTNRDLSAVLADDVLESNITRNLTAFVRAGFLRRLQRGEYVRVPSPFWGMCLAIAAETAATTPLTAL